MLDSKDKIQLFKGECLEIMDELIAQGVKVDAIITDIPYGVITGTCGWDIPIPFEEMWDRIYKLKKPNSPILLFGRQPFTSALNISNIKDFRYEIIGLLNIMGKTFITVTQ